MNIGVIGSGYVGLVTGACLADFGHNVVCADKDEKKIEALKKGKIPIYEPGLDDMVGENVKAGRLLFTKQVKKAVDGREAVFIAVGTPTSRRGDGYADLTYVKAAAKEVAGYIKGYVVIVNKSTVPVGTAEIVRRIIKKESPSADFDVVSNPEFLREGAAIDDFTHPDKIVIGSMSDRAKEVMARVYRPLSLREAPIVNSNLATSELIKYANNAFLATKISFINEISALCEKVGADVTVLAKAIGMDKRIGPYFLHAGPGFGGSCFPKDIKALIAIAKEHGVRLRTVEAAKEANEDQKVRMVRKIRGLLGGNEFGKKIGVLGLTFKPETDDMRDAPALTILEALAENGAEVVAFDPQGMKEAATLMPNISLAENAYEVCKGADILVILTEWNEFRGLDLREIKKLMRGDALADLRNVFDPVSAKSAGFRYEGVGKGEI